MEVLFIIVAAALFVCGGQSAMFTVKNNCPFTIWPATLTGAGSVPLTGFELAPQASSTVTITPPWSGRFWARTQCSSASGTFTCGTGNCGSGQIPCNGGGGQPPMTLVEFTLAGSNGRDFYDVSLVDGFNLPVKVQPNGNCPSTACPADINNHACPNELAIRSQTGGVIGCKSACGAFHQPQYCCTGPFGSPNTCKPSNYSQIFKRACPQAYSYAFDDRSSTFTCPTGVNYQITFCP